uniref:Uncharacterized protein n=1 Tax=Arundo donax TaxID=35708 RepID=A0A0A9DI44_ARUDO
MKKSYLQFRFNTMMLPPFQKRIFSVMVLCLNNHLGIICLSHRSEPNSYLILKQLQYIFGCVGS